MDSGAVAAPRPSAISSCVRLLPFWQRASTTAQWRAATHDYLHLQHGGKVSAELFIVSVDLVTRTLVVSRNARCPVLLRQDGTVRWLDEASDAVGIYRYTKPSITEIPLCAETTVVVFTDGVWTRDAGHWPNPVSTCRNYSMGYRPTTRSRHAKLPTPCWQMPCGSTKGAPVTMRLCWSSELSKHLLRTTFDASHCVFRSRRDLYHTQVQDRQAQDMQERGMQDGILPLIKVVGVSASGKSTLVHGLHARGYRARPVSQEHSSVPDLWQQFERAAVLIYLDLTLDGQRQRRPDVSWSLLWYFTELNRLQHPRSHADLQIDTTNQVPGAVLSIALVYLEHRRVRCSSQPLPPLSETGSARPAIGGDV